MTGAASAEPPRDGSERWITGRAAWIVGFLWGFCEATWFFIVPDVWLTLVACFRWKPALVSGLVSLVGALIGGAVMAAFGARAPEEARAFLERVPAIHAPLVVEAHSQLDRYGLWGLMLGPLGGVPYKIYAVDWGARHGSLASFLVASVAARYVRFLLATLAAAAIAGATSKLMGRRMTILLWAIFWVGLYAVYFTQRGW